MRFGRHLTPSYIWHRTYVESFRRRERRKGELTVPLLAMQAIQLLDGWLRPTDEMLEYGSGGSTRWFASKVKRLVSVEDDPQWYETVSSQTRGMANLEYHLLGGAPTSHLAAPDLPSWRTTAPADYLRVAEAQAPSSFDVVLNDGWGRDAVGVLLVPLVKPGGLLVWDDDPPAYMPLLGSIADWRRIEWFDGVHRTTVFFRPPGI